MASIGAVQVFPASQFEAKFAVESSFNAGYSTTNVLGVLGLGMNLTAFKVEDQFEGLFRLGSRTAQTFYSKGVKVSIDADFVLAADNGNWLKAFFDYSYTTTAYPTNPATTTAKSVTAYTVPDFQTSSTGAGKLPSLSVAVHDAFYNMYIGSGLVANTVDINYEEGAAVDVKLNFLGTDLQYYAKGSASIPTGSNSFSSALYPSQPLTWAATVISSDTTSSSQITRQPVKSFKLKLDNDVDMFYALGDVFYSNFVPRKFKVSGSIDVYHDSGIVEQISSFAKDESSHVNASITLKVANSQYGYIFIIDNNWYNEGGFTLKPVDPVIDNLTFEATNVVIQYG